MTELHIACVDDFPMAVAGIRGLLREVAPQIRCVGEARSAQELRTKIGTWDPAPSVILYDLNLRDDSSFTTEIAGLCAKGFVVVVCTGEFRPVPIREAVQAGAAGVILKSDPATRIAEVIERAASGEFAVSGPLARELVENERLIPLLAEREREVLELMAAGVPRKVIGKHLSPPIMESTVVTYLKRVVDKYRTIGRDVQTPGDAVREAVRDGFIGTSH